MIEIGLTLKALSPLALHQNRASAQFAPTLDYIPGSTLRGALAGLYLQGDAARAQDEDFQSLFLNNQVFYSDLLPATNIGKPWHLVPATALACKRYGTDIKKGHPKSVTDTLLRLGLTEYLWEEHKENWREPWKAIEGCPTCKAEHPTQPPESRPRARIKEQYASSLEPTCFIEKMPRRLRTGTAVDRATGAVASGMLFSQQVMGKSQNFACRLRLLHDEAERLKKLLAELAPQGTHLHLGYGRSRGLGHVQVIDWGTVSPAGPSLQQRWQLFNKAVQLLWKRYKLDTPSERYFSLTLTSHLALRDATGQPVLDGIEPAHLGLPWAELGWRDLTAVAVPGWNAAWGLPKPDTWALARGSVLLARVPAAQEKATLARLAELEATGLGERRAEGFGQLRVCDEFHYVFTFKELRS